MISSEFDSPKSVHLSPVLQMPAMVTRNQSRLLRAQIVLFVMTYIAYSLTHVQREFWAMSKEHVKPELGFEDDQLSNFDFSQLVSYSLSLYLFGTAGDRLNKKKLLVVVYLASGFFFFLQGLGGLLKITSPVYYFFVFPCIGISTSFIFAVFIALLADWFPKRRRGIVIGTWTSCINIGNIVGVQLASGLLSLYGAEKWYYLMFTVACLMILFAVLFLLFLVIEPEDIGLEVNENEQLEEIQAIENEEIIQLNVKEKTQEKETFIQQNSFSTSHYQSGKRINFLTSWRVPRVFLYSCCFFTVKLAVTSFLLLLPSFLKQELDFSDQKKANMSTCFDSGAIFGNIILGYLTDKLYSKRSPATFIGLACASTLSFSITFHYKDLGDGLYAIVFFLGFFLSAICNIISASVAADLGKQKALQNNPKALCIVTSVIDGSGGMGSALGQLIIGQTKAAWGWQNGFWLVVSIDIALTCVPLFKILVEELIEIKNIVKNRRQKQ
ncbi:glycerol-3-phosphate transporter 5-like [Stylonychia lemnae]|uniref:Glycerol-3-phosphate transporter 5-like n=1 Tax=Stylonychia lemnae TaxID=5949 RepID=A0A078AUY1_STYLE|nr:glycerol-3-phosphate transporter 5-like [Stylonychia lemnae]|eukprot:CDW86014.1 glycerol-3-phosphate transporter 5-like [Stylonychia lemnae]